MFATEIGCRASLSFSRRPLESDTQWFAIVSRTWVGRAIVIASFVAAVGGPDRPAMGLDIILNPINSASLEFPTVGAPWQGDPDQSGLLSLFQQAERYYESIIKDDHELTINFWYEDIPSLALHQDVRTSGSGAQKRETEAFIRVDTLDDVGNAHLWWIDPTPWEDGEFDMRQTLWRGLPGPNNQPFSVAIDVPKTFEVGYSGAAIMGGSAAAKYDLYTSVLHEVGHALGLNGVNPAQTNDGDYDFDSSFIFGATLGVNIDTDKKGKPDPGHLHDGLNDIASLCGSCATTDLRRLPGHTDILALASAHKYTNLDLPRREFYGNSNWNNAGNWSGNKVPDYDDDVFIRDAQGAGVTISAVLHADSVARNVTVSNGANLRTDGFTLAVNNVTASDTNSDVLIEAGGSLEADSVFIKNAAEIEMSSGSLIARRIVIDAGTQLEGTSGVNTVNVAGALVNNGQIDTASGANINFVSSGEAPWDLDGASESGIVDASDGSLNFVNGALADPFDGTMHVGAGHVVDIAADWTNSTGTIHLNGQAPDSPARISGAFGGSTINFLSGQVRVSGVAEFDVDVDFFQLPNSTDVTLGENDTLEFKRGVTINGGDFNLGYRADVHVNDGATVSGGDFAIGREATIQFNGQTTVRGGTFNTVSNQLNDGFVIFNDDTTYDAQDFTIHGLGIQEGNATVSGPTTVTADVFDMDGVEIFGGNVTASTWTVNELLTINARHIDDDGQNVFNDHITVNSASAAGGAGRLTINLPEEDQWTLGPDARLTVTGQTNSFPNALAGSPFHLEGHATITSDVAWEARTDVSGQITINGKSGLRLIGGTLRDPNQMAGGTISGAGSLSARTGRALVGHGTIAAGIDFADGTELLADNGTLILSGPLDHGGVIGTADADGTLRVTNAWNTDLAEAIEIRGGTVEGGIITNQGSGLIRGFGLLKPAGLDNNSTIAAEHGTLTIAPANQPDLDGSKENGVIEAIRGNLIVVDPVQEFFDGTASVGPNRLLTFRAGWQLGPGGQLNLFSGNAPDDVASIDGASQLLHGTVNIGNKASFDVPTTFKGTVLVSLPERDDTLRLTQPSTIEAGAALSGDGVLVNSSTLALADGASVGVRLLNSGSLEIGASLGAATALAYQQTQLGTLHIELAGTDPGAQYDRLGVTEVASLAGTLEVSAINEFTPALGDVFDILTAEGGVTELFSNTVLPTLSSELTWDLFYGATSVSLSVAPLDCNFDGLFDLWDANCATAGTIDAILAAAGLLKGDADGDGQVLFSDFLILADNFREAGQYTDGDFDKDGTVQFGDFLILAENFRQTASATAAVPEPSSIALITLGGLLMMVRRRRCSVGRPPNGARRCTT